MKTLIRPATVVFTVVLALSALLGSSAQSAETGAVRRMLAIDPIVDPGQQVASRRMAL